ncbi:MAG: hypothetical protein JST16_11990 [Bdellovibrionales bacterium]|nr:hypothetical protein [Bdellovibrionales bacterium]
MKTNFRFLFSLALTASGVVSAYAADPSNKIATSDLHGFVVVDRFTGDGDSVSCWGRFEHVTKRADGKTIWTPVELAGGDSIACSLGKRSEYVDPDGGSPDDNRKKLPYVVDGVYEMTFRRWNGEVYRLQNTISWPASFTYHGGAGYGGQTIQLSWERAVVDGAMHIESYVLENGTEGCASSASQGIWDFYNNGGHLWVDSSIVEKCPGGEFGVFVSYLNTAQKPDSLGIDFLTSASTATSHKLDGSSFMNATLIRELKLRRFLRFLPTN